MRGGTCAPECGTTGALFKKAPRFRVFSEPLSRVLHPLVKGGVYALGGCPAVRSMPCLLSTHLTEAPSVRVVVKSPATERDIQ